MGEARLGGGGGGARGWSLRARGLPRGGEEGARERMLGKGRLGWAAGSPYQGLANAAGCQTEVVSRRTGGQMGGPLAQWRKGEHAGHPLPAESRVSLAWRSLLGRRGGLKGAQLAGRRTGAEGRRKKGEIGGRKSPTGLLETCHPGRVGHQLPPSLCPSLLSQRLLPASRQGEPGARRCWLVSPWWPRDKKGEILPPPGSQLNSSPDREQGMLSSRIPPSLASPPRPRGLQGSYAVQGT